MKRRVLAALLVSALTVATVVGCGSKSSDSTKEETKTESTEAKGTDFGTITVVTGGTGEPYSLMDDAGSKDSWTGIDAEMWAEIEKRTGWTVEVKRTAFESLWGELDTGRADVAANCFAVKQERTDKYNATIPYYGDSQNVIVNEDNKDTIKTFEDLKGKKVGYKTGQAAQTFIDDNQEKYGYEVVAYEDSAIGMQDLGNGRIDAFANTRTNINQFLNGNPQFKFVYFEENLMANNVAYFLPKTERGDELTAELDKVLQEMLDDGTVSKIVTKWLFDDMTKLIQK